MTKNPYNRKVKIEGARTKSSSPKIYSQKKEEIYDKEAVRELKLYEENNYDLYKSSKVPIFKNLQKKKDKGVYDSEKAEKLFKYHADRSAKAYEKEYGGKFTPADRRALARELREEFEAEYNVGNRWEK